MVEIVKEARILVGDRKGELVLATLPDESREIQVIYSTGAIDFFKDAEIEFLESPHD